MARCIIINMLMLIKRFYASFAGLERAHGVYELPSEAQHPGSKVKGRAITITEPVLEKHWEDHLLGIRGIGIIPIRDDANCWFGAIDLDKNDIDHAALEKTVVRLGLPLTICRSKSGGAHLYLFLKHLTPATIVRGHLTAWTALLGYPKAEIFPKQTALASNRDVGNWINMPYFDYKKTNRYAIFKGSAIDAEKFLDLAEKRRVTVDQLSAIKLPDMEDLLEAPPCLQTICNQGIGEGYRNIVLFNLAVYCRARFGDDAHDKLLAYNEQYGSPPLESKELGGLLTSAEKKNYVYTCSQSPLSQHCQRGICRTRKYGISPGDHVSNLEIGPLTKINSYPPTWFLTVNGARIELTTDDLYNQAAFHKLCISRLNVWPNDLKPVAWKKLVQDRLTNAEIVEAPEDASAVGQFMHHVEQYCMGRASAKAQDELLQGKPWFDEARIYFRSVDMLRYLELQHFKVSSREAWSTLQQFGGKSNNFKLKGKKVMCWSVPEFEKQTEEFTVHEAPKEQF